MQKRTRDDFVRISKEIRKLLLNALNRKSWYFFRNPRLCNCWEEMNCANTRCPSYKSANLRCWQISGTFCKGEPQGEFAKKFGDCQKCSVYKKATEGNPVLQIGEDFNNLMFQLKTKEDELRLSVKNSKDKNRKLTALNDRISELVRKLDAKNALLKELSIKDGLTGLYNYRFFRELLYEQYSLAKRYKFPLSCVMIDIDYFKAINDTYGHQCGDLILSQLADILKKSVRETDKIVRYGGEEFVILFPYTGYEDAYIKAEKLRKIVSDYNFSAGRKKLGITISLGVAAYPDGLRIKRAERLVSLADKALYLAKERGRNQTALYKGETVFRGNTKKKRVVLPEKRGHPRIQSLIKIEGRDMKSRMFFSNTFDISYSGLSLLSAVPLGLNNALKIKLILPGIDKNANKTEQLKLDGLVVRCVKIGASSVRQQQLTHVMEAQYLIGVQFRDVTKKRLAVLQKYFISLFKRQNSVSE